MSDRDDQDIADWRERRGRHRVQVLQTLGEVQHKGRIYRSVTVQLEDGSEYISLRLYNAKGKFIKQLMVEPEIARDLGRLLDPGRVAFETLRAEAETKAWESLARYKFIMFGYHAAIWVYLNRLCLDKYPNPFKGLVAIARAYSTDWWPRDGKEG